RRRSSTSSAELVETADYDSAGRPTSTTRLPSQLDEDHVYGDVLGRLTQTIRSIHTVDDAGADQTLTLTESRTYDDGAQTVTIVENATTVGGTPRSKTTTLTLDLLDRVVKVQENLPQGGTHTRTITYSADGL